MKLEAREQVVKIEVLEEVYMLCDGSESVGGTDMKGSRGGGAGREGGGGRMLHTCVWWW